MGDSGEELDAIGNCVVIEVVGRIVKRRGLSITNVDEAARNPLQQLSKIL